MVIKSEGGKASTEEAAGLTTAMAPGRKGSQAQPTQADVAAGGSESARCRRGGNRGIQDSVVGEPPGAGGRCGAWR